MIDYICIGSAPANETCVSVDPNNGEYIDYTRAECRVYKSYLERIFKEKLSEMTGVWFAVKRFSHDFGDYYEVVIMYDDFYGDDAEDNAYELDDDIPGEWDDQARFDLQIAFNKLQFIKGVSQ